MIAPVDVTNIRIETNRLILRPWRQEDLEDFYAYARVDGVGQMAGWQPHESIEKSQTILDGFIREKFNIRTRRLILPPQEERADLAARKADPEADVLALLTRDDLISSAYAITGSMSLRTACRVGSVIGIVGGIVGIVIMLALSYLGSTELLTPARVILYQLVWMIPSLLATEWTRIV